MNDKKALYKFNSARYSSEWAVSPAEKIRVELLARLAVDGKKILDIGCYDGTIAGFLKNKNNQVFGIEISEDALKLATKRGILCIRADINEAIPFKDNSFDLVLCGEVIEHIFQMQGFFREIKRVLKKNGSLLISTPNLASLGRRLFLFFGKNPLIEIDADGEAAGHIRYFVKDSLFELLRKYGFKIVLYCSDVVNFDNSARRFSSILAKILPGIGKSIIIKAINEKD